jgi:RNA polymerase sigma factor (TIGR02999 family)
MSQNHQPDSAQSLTGQFAAAAEDDRSRAALLDKVYADLLKLARSELSRHRRGETLNTRALVNEAYLKLFGASAGPYSNRQHFFGAAGRAMRQVIVDYARSRLAERRGCGAEHVSIDHLDAQALPIDSQAECLVAIDAGLSKLSELDPRLAQIVELRFFAGMEVDELAELLGVSVPTIVRETRTAKAFLQKELDLPSL